MFIGKFCKTFPESKPFQVQFDEKSSFCKSVFAHKIEGHFLSLDDFRSKAALRGRCVISPSDNGFRLEFEIDPSDYLPLALINIDSAVAT